MEKSFSITNKGVHKVQKDVQVTLINEIHHQAPTIIPDPFGVAEQPPSISDARL